MFLRDPQTKTSPWFPKCFSPIIPLLAATIALPQNPAKPAPSPSVDTREILEPDVRLKLLQEQKIVSRYSGLIPEGDLKPKTQERDASPPQEADRNTSYHFDVTDPGTLVRGQKETATIRFIDAVLIDDGSGDTWELPLHNSRAIILGTVQSGKILVDNDRDYVYSAFTLQVEQVLKQDEDHPLSVGEAVVGVRPGGVIHFPSGHVTSFVVVGNGFPAVGARYLLFLNKTRFGLREYGIGPAYELKDGKVLPLDEGPYQKFKGVPIDDFLVLVRQKK